MVVRSARARRVHRVLGIGLTGRQWLTARRGGGAERARPVCRVHVGRCAVRGRKPDALLSPVHVRWMFLPRGTGRAGLGVRHGSVLRSGLRTARRRLLRSAVLFADTFAIPPSGIVTVQEVPLLIPPTASLGLGENDRTSRPLRRARNARRVQWQWA
jgi:hypothetical protein